MWILSKTARAGRLIWEERHETLDDVAKRLKVSQDIVEQIRKKDRFPKGKLCVFNKFSLREETKAPEICWTVSFL